MESILSNKSPQKGNGNVIPNGMIESILYNYKKERLTGCLGGNQSTA